jgi:uncharacterized iron-regulated membrane protein
MRARQLHRGTMTVGGLLLAYWVLSGLSIAIFDAADPHQVWAGLGGGPGARLNDAAAAATAVPSPATFLVGIGRALDAASAARLPVAGVDYRMAGSMPRLELSAADGNRDTELRFHADTGQPMTPRDADGDPFAPRPPVAERREFIKSLHKGDALGLPGQTLGLLTGMLLLTMVLSGATLYLRLWWARRKAGRAAFFWAARESRWRRLHRGIAIVAALFLLNKAVTGTLLAWGEIQVQLAIHHLLPFPYPMPTPMPPYSEARLSEDLLRGLQTSYDAAHAAAPRAPIVAIDLVQRDHRAKGIVTLGGPEPRTLAFDLHSGRAVDDPDLRGIQVGNRYFADWHQVVKRLHRGDIIGRFAGRYADIACGAALLYLVLSGFVLYAQLRQLRARNGQTGLFWR